MTFSAAYIVGFMVIWMARIGLSWPYYLWLTRTGWKQSLKGTLFASSVTTGLFFFLLIPLNASLNLTKPENLLIIMGFLSIPVEAWLWRKHLSPLTLLKIAHVAVLQYTGWYAGFMLAVALLWGLGGTPVIIP